MPPHPTSSRPVLPDLAQHWLLEEDDFGGPLVFHRHTATAVPAYVIGGTPDHRIAQCSDCMATLEFSERALESTR